MYSIHPLVKARRSCICADMINGDGELVAGTTNPMPSPVLMSEIKTSIISALHVAMPVPLNA